MTDEKRLFDKSPDELREAFIRNRFGQHDVFGLIEIEQWLTHQRTVERPDEMMWQSFLTRDFLTMCAATAPLTHLRERATRQYAQGTESDDPYWGILSLFRGGYYQSNRRVGVYTVDGVNDLFVLDRDASGRIITESIDDANISVGARAVVDILFAEWDRQRPKWSKARQFLCDALAEEIKRERAKAEADVATAVAISADGTKIVHADWVVVTGLSALTRGAAYYYEFVGNRTLAFPGTAFHNRKILRSDGMTRSDYSHALVSGIEGATIEERIAKAASVHLEAQYGARTNAQTFCYGGSILPPSKYPVFFTTPDFCPSPLPDGGVAVTV